MVRIYREGELDKYDLYQLTKLKRRIELLLEHTGFYRDKYFQAYQEVRTEINRRKVNE